jgi:alpha-N-arabinofuranosidase
MYKNHQESTLVESYLETEMIGMKKKVKFLIYTESVSVDSQGRINITINIYR